MENYSIAIVDDEAFYLSEIEKIVRQYFSEKQSEITVAMFDNIVDFKKANSTYDLIILDINIKQYSGLDLKKDLEMEDNDSRIIFVTNFEDYMIDSFGTNVLGFVLKDDLTRLGKIIDVYINSLKFDKKYVVLNDVKININDVMYCYAISGYVKTYYIDENNTVRSLLINKSLAELNKLLGEKQFVSCHKSYFVNLLRVKKIESSKIVLDLDIEVPLSRRKYTDFKKEFIEYIKHRKK